MAQPLRATLRLKRPRNIFYGWWLVGISGVTMALLSGAGAHSLGIFLVALERHFGWSRAALSVAFSLGRAEGALFGPIEGVLTDRLGARRMVFMGLLIFGAGFIVLRFIQDLLGFYVAFGIIFLGVGLAGFLPLISALNHWFRRRKTTAMALAMTGNSMGGLIVPALAVAIATFGWQNASLGMGLGLAALSLPISLMIRDRPEKYGLRPDGDPPIEANDANAPGIEETESTEEEGLTLQEALRTRALWIITFAHTCAGIAVAVAFVHIAPHLTDRGLSLEMAGTIVATYTLIGVVSQLTAGIIGDRLPKPPLIAFFIALQGTGMLLAVFISNVPTALLFGIVFGLGFGGRTTLLTAIRGEYFGRRAFATIVGVSQLPMNIIWMGAPILAGYLFDIWGSYTLPFIALAIFNYVGAAIILLARKPPWPTTRHLEPSQQLSS